MSGSTRPCPFCGAGIQLGQTSRGSGTKASTILKVVGVAIAVPCAAATVAGFGAGGVAAGSAATMWQASFGNVAAGSAFAALQSAGAAGGFYSGMAVGGTSFGAGKWWESSKYNMFNKEGRNGKDGDSGVDGVNKKSSDRTESKPDEGDAEQISVTCPHCKKSFEALV
ncbi:unnamed protein product [Cylindrotheca closterium]|uniref:Uncharacterized protein n=1 Tax=Cylindrotheca closterium TaxID=2856 RepID=A0AAD2JM09_9STRA|nr:unnamed protein product [Cylindrotheca closterium]